MCEGNACEHFGSIIASGIQGGLVLGQGAYLVNIIALGIQGCQILGRGLIL